METQIFGYTSHQLPILSYHFMSTNKIPNVPLQEVLILGGVHGDETEGVIVASELLNYFIRQYALPFNITLIPQFNVEGVISKTRMNWNGVDLNRNLSTQDWSSEIKTPRYHPGPSAGSESENQALMKWLQLKKPALVLSLHSWKPLLNVNGNCLSFAQNIAQSTGYIIEDNIGYPTPGCLGTYAGIERDYPTLTYEIERGQDVHSVLAIHPPAIIAALKNLNPS